MLGTTTKHVAALALLSLLPFGSSASETTGFPPCDALISAGLSDRLLLATSLAYEPHVQTWYSANGRLRPWCFVQPHNTQEVSAIVSTLNNPALSGAGDWHIAVRSGGHGPPGSNNIANGVTIDLSLMNGSSYDAAKGVASVQPGGKWVNVYYNLLQNYNVTVTGGRDGDVGVGGFLLGGGNSYYSGRNGFGCDTVVNYEVVLANGTIVNANANENPKLYKALKGGALNFGIVTRFDMMAMPSVDLAYGLNVIASNYSDHVLDAVADFAGNGEEAGSDALITLYTHDVKYGMDMTIVMIRVNTKGDLNTTSFEKVTRIPSLTSSWELMSLADAANGSQVPGGSKNYQTTITFLNSPSVLRKATDLHNQLVSTLSAKIGSDSFLTGMFFQPLSTYFNTIGQRNTGGNMLGLSRIPSNAILWTLGVGITNGDDAALEVARAELNAMTVELKDFAKMEGKMADLVYLNYADAGQDPLGSYGEDNVRFLKEVANMYDPRDWWQERVPGGFKISRVNG